MRAQAFSLNPNVAALIVTRNRLAALQQCVLAIEGQSYGVAETIVVDSDSTDGTQAWLAARQDVTAMFQPNLGGAGGFHNGMVTALAHGHEWIWCMDDDGYAAPECLESLLAVKDPECLFRSPLVLCDDKPNELAFVLRPPSGEALQTQEEFRAAACDGLVRDVACPFNGVLIHRQIIERIGLPLAEMFLWGDENEYFLRTKRAGYTVVTVGAALFYHPRDRMLERRFKVFGHELCIVYVGNPLRDYLAIRNRAYILRHYFGLPSAVRHARRYALAHAKLEGFRGFLWALGAAWAGMRGDWRGHLRYLA